MEPNIKSLLFELKDQMKIFHFLDETEIENLSPCFEIVHYPASSVIFNENDPGDYLGFVISGKLEVKKETEFKGKHIVLAIIYKGSIVGEFSVIDGQPRSATVKALEDSELLMLRCDSLEDFFERHPRSSIKLLKGILRIMSIRHRQTLDRLASIF